MAKNAGRKNMIQAKRKIRDLEKCAGNYWRAATWGQLLLSSNPSEVEPMAIIRGVYR